VAEVFPEADWQHCTMHRLMSLWKDIGDKGLPLGDGQRGLEHLPLLDKVGRRGTGGCLGRSVASSRAWAVQRFMEDLTDSLMFYSLPKDWWRKTRTNNYLERMIRTLRMRLRNMGCFYDKPATERAVFGQLARPITEHIPD
jgi:putative transposase